MNRRHLVITLALAACGGTAAKPKPGEEYLRKIVVDENKDLGDKRLLEGLALRRTQRKARPPDPYLVSLDAERIKGEYLREGYFDIAVHSRVEHHGDASDVVYTVEEGPRSTTRVEITGIADPALVAEVRDSLPLAEREPFHYAAYDTAKEQLIVVVQDAGYARAKLDSKVVVDRAGREAIVQLHYDLGTKCRFGNVEITGVSGELERAIRRRLAFAENEPYSTRAILATRRNLYGLARFSTVQVEPDTSGTSDRVGVKVSVSQSARREVRLGGGAGLDPTAYEVRGRAGYTIAGWPFPLDTASIDLRPAYAWRRDGGGAEPRMRALARLERQDLFWTYATGSAEAGYNYLALESYTTYGPRAGLGFTTPLKSHRVQLRLGWGLEQTSFRNVSEVLDAGLRGELGLDGSQRNGAYRQTLVVDLRDNPLATTRGGYGEVQVAEGTRFAGGSLDYVEVIPELRGFLPLGSVVLAAKARAGGFFGDVPVTERFYGGGSSHHRGFGERALSPFATAEIDGATARAPFGGAAMVETGLEARIPITTWRSVGIGSVLFLDGGDVTRSVGELDPTNLHWAAGGGLRFLTLVGPIRADLGYRLNRTGPMEPAAGSKFAFHLSLGEAF